jgi:hypothetical protein
VKKIFKGEVMKKIFKYALKVGDIQAVEMPEGAAVLCVQAQNEAPCIWAAVDPKARKIIRRFRTYGTGHPMDDADRWRHYVGTYQLKGGLLVFHVYTDREEYSA